MTRTAAASAGARLVPVASVADVPAGWVLTVRAGRREIALANCGGEISAFANACPHAGGPLGDNRVRNGCVTCPWHGAAFDVRTGEVRDGPARKPVATYAVEIHDGTIYVALG